MAIATHPFFEGAGPNTRLGLAWLKDIRQAASDRFAAAGLPTTRLESWRTTPLPEFGQRGLAQTGPATSAESLAAPFIASGAVTFVFVDGAYSDALSTPGTAHPGGLRFEPLSRRLTDASAGLKTWFPIGDASAGAMQDLNTAGFTDGACIEVEGHAAPALEVRILFISTRQAEPSAQYVRNIIRLDKGASLRLTLVVVGADGAAGFINSNTQVALDEKSRLDLVRLHESSEQVPHFDSLAATVGPYATFNDTLMQTGPSWTRSEIHVRLNGEQGTADLGGVFIAQGTQISDIHTVLSHEARGVVSRQNYRGLAADEARGVFHGQIQVTAEARGADATQNNRNMLLSKRAQVHSTPALEILTDDVKCKHGSATGQIDPAQLFYLRSRGIEPEDAVRMLTRAFAGEIVSRIGSPATRTLVETQIAPSLEKLGAAA